jgi:hypothetical protein
MELLVTDTELKLLSKSRTFEKESQTQGILNSNYKQVVNQNLKSALPSTLFGLNNTLRATISNHFYSYRKAIKINNFHRSYLMIFA